MACAENVDIKFIASLNDVDSRLDPEDKNAFSYVIEPVVQCESDASLLEAANQFQTTLCLDVIESAMFLYSIFVLLGQRFKHHATTFERSMEVSLYNDQEFTRLNINEFKFIHPEDLQVIKMRACFVREVWTKLLKEQRKSLGLLICLSMKIPQCSGYNLFRKMEFTEYVHFRDQSGIVKFLYLLESDVQFKSVTKKLMEFNTAGTSSLNMIIIYCLLEWREGNFDPQGKIASICGSTQL